jgi:hypothetical protein
LDEKLVEDLQSQEWVNPTWILSKFPIFA